MRIDMDTGKVEGTSKRQALLAEVLASSDPGARGFWSRLLLG